MWFERISSEDIDNLFHTLYNCKSPLVQVIEEQWAIQGHVTLCFWKPSMNMRAAEKHRWQEYCGTVPGEKFLVCVDEKE